MKLKPVKILVRGPSKYRNLKLTHTNPGKNHARIVSPKTRTIKDLPISFVNPVIPPSDGSTTSQTKTNNIQTFQNAPPAAELQPSISEINPQNQIQTIQTQTTPSGATEGTNLIVGLSQEQKDLLIQKLIGDVEELRARAAIQPLPGQNSSGGLAGIANNVIGLITQVLAKVPLSENEGPNMQALMAQNWMTLMQGMMAKQLGINVTMNGSVGVGGN